MDRLRAMDTDRSGTVSKQEFRAAIKFYDVDISEAQIESLITSIDKDGDGEFDMNELIKRFEASARAMKRQAGVSVATVTEEGTGAYGDEPDGNWLVDEAEKEFNRTKYYSLAEEEKNALRNVLRMLVMSQNSNKLLIMSLESEALREVVMLRYVNNFPIWHKRLVRYFENQPPSLRRCEELPWHLCKCYKWRGLKDTLVDLRTFELMWETIALKRELIQYWKVLSEGPLYVSEETEAAADQNQQNTRLADIPSTVQYYFGSNRSCSPILASTGKMAPFDLVIEYNRAVESWQAGGNPNLTLH
ncbi:unnamed protein product [Chrysoparadoxa australica]